MNIAGYASAILIGISLGLIGGGGSILTLPVLVYLFKMDTALATVYSLFIVGCTSMAGAISYYVKNLIHFKTAVVFSLPAVAAIFLTRTYIVPAIPPAIFSFKHFTIKKDMLLLLLFAVIMIMASVSMIRRDKAENSSSGSQHAGGIIFFYGIIVGFITGLIGAGGGFLIIPVLAKRLRLPIKTAVGTSLVVITVNSLFGFLISIKQQYIDWSMILSITFFAMLGILSGSLISGKMNSSVLKPAFGWFVLAMGTYILLKETILQ